MMQGVPDSEISAVIDKVEVAADHFKYRKCFRRAFCLYFLVLLLVSAGIAVHHLRHRRRHHGGPHSPLGHFPGPVAHHGHMSAGAFPADGKFPTPTPAPAPGFPAGPKPSERGCWKRRHDKTHKNCNCNRAEESQVVPTAPESIPSDPEVPAEPAQTEPGSKPRQLQADSPVSSPAIDSPATASTSTSSPAMAPQVDPFPGSIGAPEPTVQGQTEPAGRPHHGGHRWWRHWRRWMSRGHRGGPRHGPRRHWNGPGFKMGPGQGPRHGDFRGRRRHCAFKAVFFFIIVPLLMLLGLRCAKKRVARRVRELLEIENRRFREKYGCEWTTNHKVCKLTLRRVAAAQQAPLGYPAQPVYPQMSERTPFCEQAPLFTETGHVHAPEHGRRHYQRVSLDDSSIGYQYQ